MNKYEQARRDEMKRLINNERNLGARGCVFELSCAREHSRKVKVAKQGEVDVRIKYRNEEGKIVYAPAEAKTNGGRIDSLMNGCKVKFVIYTMMDVPVPQSKKAKLEGRPVQYRNIPPVVIPVDLFVEKLREFNAIKVMCHGGEVDGYGIQVTSLKLYNWLVDYPVLFDRENTYEAWEFEGLD